MRISEELKIIRGFLGWEDKDRADQIGSRVLFKPILV